MRLQGDARRKGMFAEKKRWYGWKKNKTNSSVTSPVVGSVCKWECTKNN